MIHSIDSQPPTPQQMERIKKGRCNRCNQPFKPLDNFLNVLFVETDKKLIWWHGLVDRHKGNYHCDYAPKPRVVKVKKTQSVPRQIKIRKIKKVIRDLTFEEFCNECDIKRYSSQKSAIIYLRDF